MKMYSVLKEHKSSVGKHDETESDFELIAELRAGRRPAQAEHHN